MSATPHFSLRVTPSDTIKTVISVSKKISKKAVVRNTVKRRMRPILHEFKPALKPATYTFIAKPGVEILKGEALKSELAQLLKKS